MVWQQFALFVACFCIECKDCKAISSDKCVIYLFICVVGIVVWCGNDSYFLKYVCSTECEYWKVILSDKCNLIWFFCVVIIGCVCVLLCFIKPVLGNHYVRCQGFIVSEPRETHQRSETTDVPTSPCPPLDSLGCPDPHPPP